MRPADAHGSRWGVFVGASADDFRLRYLTSGDLDRFGHMGSSRCMLANRVSHHFGLRGPSEVVDTGQSSSLAALHRAVASLRLGECDAALVAGVNLNLLQEVTEQVRLWGGLSPDGRCHTFDERANGYVRGEGGGCVVLKPLDAARRDRDHVYCVIRSTATANDAGRGVLGVPSAEAQSEVLTTALGAAGASATDVAYLELHGSGTPVGDPVEARAIGEVVGRARPHGDPVPVGSVKTNIGHLEAAAGIAGLVKACLIFHHRRIPPSLNFVRPHAGIPLDEHNIRVVTEPEDRVIAPRQIVGVSSFGMGGTHVHAVLGPAGPAPDPAPSGPQDTVWCLSARSREAVRDLALALLRHPFAPGASMADVGRALSARTQWDHRAAVLGSDQEQFRQGLEKIVAGHDLAVPADWTARDARSRTPLLALAAAYVHTADITGVRAHLGDHPRTVPLLPTYPFQRQPFRLPGAPEQPRGATVRREAPPETGQDFLPRWTGARPADRMWLVRGALEDALAAVLGGPVPDPDTTFGDLGIDSLTLLEFLERVNDTTGLGLPEIVLFDHPTLNEMAERVNKELESQRD